MWKRFKNNKQEDPSRSETLCKSFRLCIKLIDSSEFPETIKPLNRTSSETGTISEV